MATTNKDDYTEIRTLINRVLENDTDASREFFTYVEGIVAVRELSVVPRFSELSDVVQDATIKVWQRLESFTGSTAGEFRSWVTAITRNVYSDSYRFETRVCRDARRCFTVPFDSRIGELLGSGDVTPSEQASRTELQEVLDATLSQLNRDRQQLVRLRFYRSLNWSDIAYHTKKSVAACRRTYYRALEQWKLLIALELDYNDDE